MVDWKSDKMLYDTCTQCIWCIAATLSCVCSIDYVAEGFVCSISCGKGFVRPTGKQITFRWCIVGHMYSYVKEQAGRQEWERLTGFIWGLPLVNTIYDQLPNGGDAVAVCSDGILYWIHVVVHWRGFYNWNVFKWTCSKSEQSVNWIVHFVYEAVRCLFTKVQLARLI